MSAPLVVNTKDGTVWTRREGMRGGEALYAPEKCGTCPQFVMATLTELAEHGIVGSSDVLPVPVSPAQQPLALPWAHAMPDDDLHGFLGDLVSAAMGRWQHSPEVPDREVLAAIERACANWRTPGQGYRSDEPGRSVEELLAASLLSVCEVGSGPARLRLAWESARRGRRKLRARLAELEEQRERRRLRLIALQNDALNMRGALSPNGEARKVPFPLGETLTPAVEWLLNRVAELEAAQGTVYRAEYESIPMGLYTTREAARKHCEAHARRDAKGTALEWRVDEPSEDDSPEELWDLGDGLEDEHFGTGYVVTPLEIATEYDEEADE